MKIKFSRIILTAGLITGAFPLAYAQQDLPVNKGAFNSSNESLKQYKYPEWFRDAKFGIWAHWGPQAVPRQGDWYARKMYEQGSPDNKYHVEHYGHPSKFGYKDIIPLWKAERWDPEKLMALYKKAGAKYFVSMGSHHDNFFLWNSAIHKWNAVKYGPHKDVVGLWQKAALAQGLRFGVSEHLAASYTWFQASHRADTSGPMAGVPYDGSNEQYADLYHTKADPGDKAWLTTNPAWMKEWYNDVKELVDMYHPDLLYSDSKLPFDEVGRSMLANFYNGNMQYHKGSLDGVYTCKEPSQGLWAQDIERGVADSIYTFPWQTDTSIGDWYYRTGQKYRTAVEIIQMLVDIVSKNGNLLINVVQTPEGDLEPDVQEILGGLAAWIPANGEGIYGTRPWKIYGEGPSTKKENQSKGRFGGLSDTRAFQATDIRFTTKGTTLFAFCMALPESDIVITSLGKSAGIENRKVKSIKMLGSNSTLQWKQNDDALVITRPQAMPGWSILGLKIEFDNAKQSGVDGAK